MKTRTDSTPLLEKVSKVAKIEKTEPSPVAAVLFEFDEEVDESSNLENFPEIEYAEYDAQTSSGPASKKQKTYPTPKTIRENQEDSPGMRTIQYTLINEDDTSQAIETPNKEAAPQYVEFHDAEVDTKQTDKIKRRSRGFGKYVAALMMEIDDDNVFFELQRNIINSIQEAGAKQKKS